MRRLPTDARARGVLVAFRIGAGTFAQPIDYGGD
jgi:hypothetical protein